MVDLGLYNFIKNALGTGQTEAQVRDTLAKAGWAERVVTEAVGTVKKGHAPNLHVRTEISEHTEEVDGVVDHTGKTWYQRAFPMFSGRLDVAGYWKAVLVCVAFTILMWLVGEVLGFLLTSVAVSRGATGAAFWSFVVTGAFVSVFLYGVSTFFILGATVRRLHDLGLTGWTALGLFLVPLLGYGVSLVVPSEIPYVLGEVVPLAFMVLVWFWPGSSKQNRYGPFARCSWLEAFFGSGSVGNAVVVAVVASVLSTGLLALGYTLFLSTAFW